VANYKQRELRNALYATLSTQRSLRNALYATLSTLSRARRTGSYRPQSH